MHKYESWEVFGKFVCSYKDLCGDGELEDFVKAWSHGDWSEVDLNWPEFGKFVESQR